MVIEESNKKTVFKELKCGDIFYYGNIYYLRVPFCTVCDYDYNSYDLKNDDYCYFSDDKQVTPVKAKLVIE